MSGLAQAQNATGPGTVQYALDRPDGVRVSLAMVVVGAVNAGGISVHEWWDKTSPIAAVFDPPANLVAGNTIDLEGWMTTLPSGRRAVLCERIAFYLDSHGSVIRSLPPFKGILDPSMWPSKVWVSVQQGTPSGAYDPDINPLGGAEPIPSGGGIEGMAPMIAGSPSSSDGSWVYLTGQVVTHIGRYYSYGITYPGWVNVYYLQGIDRTSGVRVWHPVPYNPTYGPSSIGSVMDVMAKIDTKDGQRMAGMWSDNEMSRNIYLPRLRKIYVTTDNRTLDPCPSGYYPTSTVIRATVRDADHNPVQGVTVRFRTNKGSFSTTSIIHSYTPASPTDSQGQVTATLYAVASEWGDNDVIVEATDDSAPLAGDNPEDDPYKYDWQQLHNQYGQPYSITVSPPLLSLQLVPDPTMGAVCENQKTVTATLTMCGTGTAGVVDFSTTNGTFLESGTGTAEVTTDSGGTPRPLS